MLMEIQHTRIIPAIVCPPSDAGMWLLMCKLTPRSVFSYESIREEMSYFLRSSFIYVH